MTATKTTVECVCVWLDSASEPGKRYWVISHDRIALPSGEAASTDTISALDAEDYTEEEAMADGLLEARELGLPLYRNFAGQPAERVESPRTITVRDWIGHVCEVLTLAGGDLAGESWITGILARNGCRVADTMTDDAIRDAVYEAYSGDGYEGDPAANGLTVTVEAA